MKTIRLTMAQALVRYLQAQRTEIAGRDAPLFAGVFAIFGHGNVTCLGEALEAAKESLPTWRGQNEQSMALAAIAFAKSKRRRQIMVATSSIGPGATNMVTAAAVALANRLPVLLLGGDVFASRVPDPVLQQVEHFGNPTLSANDAFRAVSRYWDRITRPEQILNSLPQAVATMLDPGECGPAFLALCQDVQAEAFDYPARFFEPVLHRIARPRPDRDQVQGAADLLRNSRQPLLIAGGGVHYSLATKELASFAERHNLPVTETMAGRAILEHEHPRNVGAIGVTGGSAANALAAEADVVLAVGTRLQDFSTGSWSVFRNPEFRLIAINAARFDAHKHGAHAVVGDVLVTLGELSEALAGWRAPDNWAERGRKEYAAWNALVDRHIASSNATPPSYAQVVGTINRLCEPGDLALSAAGGLPGELGKAWRAKAPGTFDCEYGYSCMGDRRRARRQDGGSRPRRHRLRRRRLLSHDELRDLQLVLTRHKLILIVCDNGGFAVIDRLQTGQGGKSFNNMLVDCKVEQVVPVDFMRHAESMGARAEKVRSLAELEQAFVRAKAADRTAVVVIEVAVQQWLPGGAWWDVGVPEVSERAAVREARANGRRARGAARRRLECDRIEMNR